MKVASLYNSIYKVLTSDETVLNYLGAANDTLLMVSENRIHMRQTPPDITSNLPLITFYAKPGQRLDDNFIVYENNFAFDIYTNDDVTLAQKIGDRIFELFEGGIQPGVGLDSFDSTVVSMHESSVELFDTYCFTIVIKFSYSLEH
ncbi:hypothetical protein ACSVDA_12010 [Cytobacillus sp. Hm23]